MRYIEKFKNPADPFVIRADIPSAEAVLDIDDSRVTVRSEALSCTAEFTEDESGVISRQDKIKNISPQPITLSCALSKFVFDGGEYRVYTEYSEWCGEGMGRWQPLVTEVGASNEDVRTNVMSTPFLAIYNEQTGRGVAFHILAESTWCYRVRKYYSATGHRKTVEVELGIRERGFSFCLGAGEELLLPEILFYEFERTADMDAYKLHRYMNRRLPAKAFPVTYNSWMCSYDDISFDGLCAQLKIAKELGCEYFTVDAGWFDRPHVWFNRVGDWQECLDCNLKGRLLELADRVRAEGLKFGLWFEIERASASAEAVKEHPEYYFREGEHFFVDFAKPEACEFIFGKLSSLIKRYGIEFIKFDFNASITEDGSHRSFIDYFRGYNGFIKRLNEEFPSLYLQNCASGGLRMSLTSLFGFDSFWISDNHSLYTQLEVFKSALKRIPCRALEKYLTISSLVGATPVYGGGVGEKILTSGDQAWDHVEAVDPSFLTAVTAGGPIGISCDLTKLSENTRRLIADTVSEFKRDRSFRMNAECRILCDTESMLVLQLCDSELSDIRIYAYVKVPHQNELTVYPVCDESAVYSISGESVSGKELKKNGVVMPIGRRYTASSLAIKRI